MNNYFVYTLFVLITFLFTNCTRSGNPEESGKGLIRTTPENSRTIEADTANWFEIKRISPGMVLDLRYATANNFLGQVLYPCDRCFLRPNVAKALQKASNAAQEKGLLLVLFDCYRPHSVQKQMWKLVPDTNYVADPQTGSMHNRGLAVDLSLAHPDSTPVNMGTPFDFFGPEASIDYAELPDTVLKNRLTLKLIMEDAGFSVLPSEWWHYSLKKSDAPIDERTWSCPQ